MGVLATVSGGRPHCSLMVYATDDACREIYMVTHRNTRKFRNLQENAQVSILVDSRGETDGQPTRAMTIEGVYEPFDENVGRESARRRLLSLHPELQSFMANPEAEVIRIRIRSFQLLNGLTDARFKSVAPDD